MAPSRRFTILRLTNAERKRGLKALERLEHLDRELLDKRKGEPFPPSHETLDRVRDERARAMGDE